MKMKTTDIISRIPYDQEFRKSEHFATAIQNLVRLMIGFHDFIRHVGWIYRNSRRYVVSAMAKIS